MKNTIIFCFSIFLFVGCKVAPYKLTQIEGKQIEISQTQTSIDSIENFIKPYRDKVEKEMSSPLTFTPIHLTRRDGKLESSLGNLMADLCFEKGNPIFYSRTNKNIDFALFNYGGIRSEISKGIVTNEHAFMLMPFENNLVVVEMTSKKIQELIQFLITENKAHPLSKQVSLKLKGNENHFTINQKPLDDSKTYFVLTSDYLQSGGDNMVFFKNPVTVTNLDYKVRNAIIDYFKENDTLQVKLDNRFIREF